MSRLRSAFALTFSAVAVCAHAQFNSNLVVNGDAENGTVGWTVGGGAAALPYGAAGGFPTATDPGPANRGTSFFYGGQVDNSSLTQTIGLGFATSTIDAGRALYDLSAYLGGYDGQDDNATFAVTFLGATGNSLGTATLGPVLSADRNGVTGLFLRQATGTVPLGARSVSAVLTMTRLAGSDNDGYVDNASFVLRPTATPEPTTMAALGLGALAVARRRRKA